MSSKLIIISNLATLRSLLYSSRRLGDTLPFAGVLGVLSARDEFQWSEVGQELVGPHAVAAAALRSHLWFALFGYVPSSCYSSFSHHAPTNDSPRHPLSRHGRLRTSGCVFRPLRSLRKMARCHPRWQFLRPLRPVHAISCTGYLGPGQKAHLPPRRNCLLGFLEVQRPHQTLCANRPGRSTQS